MMWCADSCSGSNPHQKSINGPLMIRYSLKYRIALIIFALEAVMIAIVLGSTLSTYLKSSQAQAANHEQVLLNLLSEASRVALFTAEYDELQPYIENAVSAPTVERIVLLNVNGSIVVSSDVRDIGSRLQKLQGTENHFWREIKISNAAGNLGTLAIKFTHAPLMETNRDALDRGVTIALIGMLLIAVIGVAIGHLLTRRLDQLQRAAQRLAKGDLTVKTLLKGNDEVAMLGKSFDTMADNIQRTVTELHDSQSELRQAHDELEERIKDRTAQLAIARDQALESSRIKSAFLANMSHELRTPLNAIIGYSEILEEEARELDTPVFVEDLEKIRVAGTHLLGLISGILDLSKIEAGKMEFYLDTFSVRDMIEEVLQSVEPQIRQQGNSFTYEYEGDPGDICADIVKVRQVLLNLLGNAAKFTENGAIRLCVNREKQQGKEWIVFKVIDDGIGISPEQINRLFKEFSQADATTTRKYGGTGLGLTISKRYCMLMGGDITVESEFNVGSIFIVKLPVTIHCDDISMAECMLKTPEQLRLGKPPNQPAVIERRDRLCSVMVIDDDPSVRDLLAFYLRKQGFHISLAENGEEGLLAAREQSPDVIVLDVNMPGIDGWSVLQALKHDPSTSHIPVVMLTVSEDYDRSVTLGASHFVSKPFDRKQLTEAIKDCVRNNADAIQLHRR